MRYYKLAITSKSGQPMRPSSLKGMDITSLLTDGSPNPAALNIELDIPVSTYAQPSGYGYLRIWGLGLQDIGNAFDLNDAEISVYGGMSKGLPLANPAQSGLLVKGQIFQAFGNWIGTDQTVDLVLTPSTGTQDQPKNLVLNWQAGTTLASALKTCLDTAFPGVAQQITISPKLVLSHDEPSYSGTMAQLADLVKRLSKSIIPDKTYNGVDIAYNGATIVVSDLTTPPAAKVVNPQDLVGQPTWKDAGVIQVKTVMRADIGVMDTVTLPQTLVTNSQAALTRFGPDRNRLTFSGNYNVINIHHYGNFRQADAASWSTVIDLIPQAKGS